MNYIVTRKFPLRGQAAAEDNVEERENFGGGRNYVTDNGITDNGITDNGLRKDRQMWNLK